LPDADRTTSTPPSGPSLTDRLDSWKEIAAFLGRGVRTVQRWEREEGLPVHRLAHDKRGSVYARREELAAWWDSRRLTLASQPSDETTTDDSPTTPHLERATRTSAMTSWPALSSDARLIAYVSDGGQDGTTPQVWVQQRGGAALRLTHGEFHYSNVSFAPGDTHVMFTAANETGSNIYEIPTLGGEPRLVQRGVRIACASPDGQWVASIPKEGVGLRIAARGGAGFRTVAPDLVDIACLAWSPDSRCVIVHAHPSPAHEVDWWVVPIDGGPPTNTGMLRALRPPMMFVVPTGMAWVDDSIVFSAATPQGVNLYQQRLRPGFQPVGSPQQLTAGTEFARMPVTAAGTLAFISAREDANLWSIAVDASSGIARGPLRRLTRGPGILVCLSVTRDFQTLFYSSVRLGDGDIFSRDVRTGSETTLSAGPSGEKWYPAVSPSGSQLAFGTRVRGSERAMRPIFIAHPLEGTWRTLGDDCGGRPREWVDERLLIIERFGRLNTIAVIDTHTAEQRELLQSAEQSVTNTRLSPDRRWIAFEASRPGTTADVFVARLRDQQTPEADWLLVDRSASHPFWSADGSILYYTPIGMNPTIRSAIRARRFPADSRGPEGEPIAIYSSAEMVMPAYLPGTTPVATPDEIFLILGDFRGDVWLMDL
jgi:Tol biopolymer transport system component